LDEIDDRPAYDPRSWVKGLEHRLGLKVDRVSATAENKWRLGMRWIVHAHLALIEPCILRANCGYLEFGRLRSTYSAVIKQNGPPLAPLIFHSRSGAVQTKCQHAIFIGDHGSVLDLHNTHAGGTAVGKLRLRRQGTYCCGPPCRVTACLLNRDGIDHVSGVR